MDLGSSGTTSARSTPQSIPSAKVKLPFTSLDNLNISLLPNFLQSLSFSHHVHYALGFTHQLEGCISASVRCSLLLPSSFLTPYTMSSPSVAPQANDIQASGSASPETKPEQVSLLGSALLRDYGKSLDPLHTNISEEEPRDTTIALSTATTRISDPTQKVGKALTSTWAPHVQPPKPLMSQHNQSPSKVIAPHRSILRTLASR